MWVSRVRHISIRSLQLAVALVLIGAWASSGASAATIWGPTATPTVITDQDAKSVELGLKFRSDVAGTVTGVRFYKGPQNTGTHTGTLWTRAGVKLASAVFANESATGWQQVNFAAPVAIDPNTTYVVSYHAPVGKYPADAGFFQSAGVDNPPLHALRRGVDGANGVYRYGAAVAFPSTSSPATNYWVDVVFQSGTADTTPPTVTSTTPAANATGVSTGTAVSAVFSEDVQQVSIGFTLTNPAGQSVPSTVSYDALTRTARLVPSSPLQDATKYTATVSGAKDAAGNTMAPVTWSFTTASVAPTPTCPCTIWPDSTTPGTPTTADNSAVELGTRFRSDVAGYVTALRYYKGTGSTGTHVGHLWTDTGTLLSTATFTGETASGWQKVALAAPVQIQANTTYVVSFYAPNGGYPSENDYFAAKGADNAPLRAPQDGTNGANGVYVYGASAFPTFTYRSTSYWADVEFNQTADDTIAPALSARSPAPGSTTAPANATVTATFTEPVQASTVSMTLTGPGGAVTGATSYAAGTMTATFTPNAPLANLTDYTATVSGAKDAAGNTMAPVTWSFKTAPKPPPPPEAGPGGPILVVTSDANHFTKYYAEILRAEGLNAFDTVDVSSFSQTSLAGHDVVVLAETSLAPPQVTALTDFVQAGGSLIAMRPDAQLAGLLGITRQTGTLANGYLGVDTTNEAAAGIAAETMQYHGSADRYTLSGASAVATLFTDATATTALPAVTLRSVGTNGGQAAAFTYDLARSVVYTRQGNPDWAGQERDGTTPIRSDDQFFGGAQTDFVDLTKVAIPQADEQQRLLANLIGTMNRHRMPLPRLWYFPNGLKAVVVGTGDDHGNNGTAGRYDQYAANSAPGCSVSGWTCLRFTSYIYPGTPLDPSSANGYESQGFETAVHVSTQCADFTPASLETNFSSQLAEFAQRFASLPSPLTNRTHCIVWSDWLGEPLAELAHSIRLDTNYYYWPGPWVNDRPGFMTGSGIPMRFAKTDGTMVDVYQAATQMTDESQQSYPQTPDALLDRALGVQGYYGAFTANMHTDHATIFENDQLIASAQAHGVPIVTSRQLLRWLDGRNASSFKNLAWSNGTMTFSVAKAAGADGLTAMVPTASASGLLNSLTLDGSPVTYRTESIKGLEYAFFTAAAGTYSASYAPVAAAPAISALSVTATDANVPTVTLATDRATTTTVQWGETATTLTRTTSDGGEKRKHSIDVSGAKPGTTIFYRLRSRDPLGKETLWPAAASPPATFAVPATNPGPPAIGGLAVEPLPDGTVSLSLDTSQRAHASVLFGSSTTDLTRMRIGSGRTRSHVVVLEDLKPRVTYYYRVRVRNALGQVTDSAVGSFAIPDWGLSDSRLAQWRTGDATGMTFAEARDGELQLTSGGTSGTYVSRLLDAQQMVTWRKAIWSAGVPAGTTLNVSVRSGSTAEPGASWSDWVAVPSSGASIASLVKGSRYIQYQVQMSSSGTASPVLRSIGFTTSGTPPKDDTETGG
jgi:methionine-rich copper-binding protein CopC